jgi:Fe(3+) dicitrate transport protein
MRTKVLRAYSFSFYLAFGVMCTIVPHALAAPDEETLIVSGSILRETKNAAGSYQVLTKADIEALRPISIKELLSSVPGIQVVSEDRFGLKLNVSVRGLTPRRSARTLWLEDGMPIQPAPYSEPSVHYVPSFERIGSIEILKGSGEILEGPQSLGGMINFRTRPIPKGFEREVDLGLGSDNLSSVYLRLAKGDNKGGLSIDVTHKQSDGIRKGHETAFTDVALKGTMALSDRQNLTARLTYFVEDTALTESGLTQARYTKDPFANPFSNDRFDLERTALQLVHDAHWSKSLSTRTQIYAADTFRASYRQSDTSVDTMTENTATGCTGSARLDYEGFASRCGNKMRPRSFFFYGIESRATIRQTFAQMPFETIVGARLHFEDADRRRYNGLIPRARKGTAGTRLREKNIITTQALSLYAQTTAHWARASVSTGLRYEQFDTKNTSVVANFADRNLSIKARQTLVLPGLGATYDLADNWQVLAGVHRGFAPPRPDRDVDPLAPANQVKPEESTNYEVGLRARPIPALKFEATAFKLDFEKLIVSGQLLGLGSGTLVNAGAAEHSGFELFGRYDRPRQLQQLIYPYVSISLTNLSTAKFKSDVGEGALNIGGNRIPYAPEWMSELALGFASRYGFSGRLSRNSVSAQFADAKNTKIPSADGLLGLVPQYNIYALSLNYQPKAADWQVYTSIQNLTDERYIATRTDGLFAGAPRQFLLGIKLKY